MFCWREKRGGFGVIWYVSNSIVLREVLGGVCMSWDLSWNPSCWKNLLKKSHGLPELASSPPLEGGPDKNFGRPWNLIHSPPCGTPCRLFIHEVFFGPLGLHLRVWSERGQSPPFRPMRALRLQRTRAFSLVCKVALRHYTSSLKPYILSNSWFGSTTTLRAQCH